MLESLSKGNRDVLMEEVRGSRRPEIHTPAYNTHAQRSMHAPIARRVGVALHGETLCIHAHEYRDGAFVFIAKGTLTRRRRRRSIDVAFLMGIEPIVLENRGWDLSIPAPHGGSIPSCCVG